MKEKVIMEGRKVAKFLKKYPSISELRIKDILDSNNIEYSYQVVMYLSDRGYYIANFYIPKKKLILHVESSTRMQEPKYSNRRIFDYSKLFQKVQVLRIRSKDIKKKIFEEDLLKVVS